MATCPCELFGIEPCDPYCTCRHEVLSGGCSRCVTYGSDKQRLAAARRLASMELQIGELMAAARKVVASFCDKDKPGWRPSDLKDSIIHLQTMIPKESDSRIGTSPLGPKPMKLCPGCDSTIHAGECESR